MLDIPRVSIAHHLLFLLVSGIPPAIARYDRCPNTGAAIGVVEEEPITACTHGDLANRSGAIIAYWG